MGQLRGHSHEHIFFFAFVSLIRSFSPVAHSVQSTVTSSVGLQIAFQWRPCPKLLHFTVTIWTRPLKSCHWSPFSVSFSRCTGQSHHFQLGKGTFPKVCYNTRSVSHHSFSTITAGPLKGILVHSCIYDYSSYKEEQILVSFNILVGNCEMLAGKHNCMMWILYPSPYHSTSSTTALPRPLQL